MRAILDTSVLIGDRVSPDLEAATVALAAAAARAVRARLYVAHLSSELAVEAVKRARALGTSVRGESCAHYMALDSGAPLRRSPLHRANGRAL